MTPRATAGDVLRSLSFYAVFYLGSILYVVGAAALFVLGSQQRFRRVVDSWGGWHRWCVTSILRIRVRIEGALPPPGSLVALKHESFFEAIDLPYLLDNPVVFAKAELMRIPLWGMVADRYGVVEVEREAGAKALRRMLDAARRLTATGRVLAIFPEGTRVVHGLQPPLQSGFAAMYKLLGKAVVPVAVDSGPLYHRRWKRRGTITMRFGEPIPSGLPRAEIEERVHRAINQLNADPSGRPAAVETAL